MPGFTVSASFKNARAQLQEIFFLCHAFFKIESRDQLLLSFYRLDIYGCFVSKLCRLQQGIVNGGAKRYIGVYFFSIRITCRAVFKQGKSSSAERQPFP